MLDDEEEVSNLQELMPFTPDYHCGRCSAVLTKPIIRVFRHHIINGAPMLSGRFKCPNRKWWSYSHTELLLEYVNCNLNVYDEGKHFQRLWVHELKAKQVEDERERAEDEIILELDKIK